MVKKIFSYGTLQHWQCYSGSCAGGNDNIGKTFQILGRHTMMDAVALVGDNQLNDEKCQEIEKVPIPMKKGYLLNDFSTINIESLAKGMYYLKIVDKMGRFVKD